MEHNQAATAVTSLLVPQASGSNPGSALSVGRLRSSDMENLTEFMSQMTGRYPNQDMGAAAQNYLFDYSRLAQQYGLSAVKTALLNLRIKPGQRFFPSPDEAATVLESMAAEVKADALKENPYLLDPACTHVAGGYWRRYIDKDGEGGVRRCDCWLKWKGLGQPAVRDHKAVAAGA